MSGVDVLAVIRRHAESHRAAADTDAYSAQEAPKLEATCAAVAELIDALKAAERKLVELENSVGGGDDEIYVEGAILKARAALSRVLGAA